MKKELEKPFEGVYTRLIRENTTYPGKIITL